MSAEKMIVPEPRFQIGDRIQSARPLNSRRGEIVGRSFDNLLHATQWKYKIHWDGGGLTNHHYDYDIRFEEIPK